ncbi:OmpA family protein [Flavobacteriaceae bacterium]|nr:OmpA family protein [Flavobacteriaceae bacterium]
MKFLNNSEDDSQWLPISDLMTVLMAVFLIISIVFMIQIKSGANEYINTKNEIYKELITEFGDEDWADSIFIDSLDLSIKFISPEILFDYNSFILKRDFKNILDDFFPRYINIISKEKFKNEIEEIIIEGHTDSQSSEITEDLRYFGNMELSQNRAREVLKYSLLETLKENNSNKKWARNRLAAHGLSYNRPYYVNDIVDNKKSRRVEFKIKLIAESKIYEIAR